MSKTDDSKQSKSSMEGPGWMGYVDLRLNENAVAVVEDLIEGDALADVRVHKVKGATVVDCGIEVAGSLAVGRLLAEVCMADLGQANLSLDRLWPSGSRSFPCPKVTVETAQPAAACLLSQYAGWKVAVGGFFAMASGPMRGIKPREPLFEKLDYSEPVGLAVGVLETASLPDEGVVDYFCNELSIEPAELTLLAAKTASIAGGFQVVARSVETCLHKLWELGFDVTKVRSALGSAFLPPVPKSDLVAIGRTNDSILYGGEVFLWTDGVDDGLIREIGPQVPASASADYGEPFEELFKRHGGDFYKIDPMLFSPALLVINNLSTGAMHSFGKTNHELLCRSFFGD